VLSLACGLISSVGTALVLYYGALQVKRAALTLGGLLYFYTATISLFGPILALTYMNVVVQWVLAALRRIFEVLDEEVSIKDAEGAIALPEMKGHVVFRNVSLKYEGAAGYALKDLDFEVPAGSVVCLVGPSGSGKSSIVNLLLRLYDPTEGHVLIDGHDIKDIRVRSLRDHIGIVPQEPILFSGTIAENIMYGHVEATASQVVAAAKAAELHDFIYSLPEKYEAEIGERGTTLSGGQKQRLAFAMALITDPSLLILDDSMSALDAETEAKIQKTLGGIMKDRTTFVITHRMSTAMMADLILVLDRGRLVQKGTHEELVTQPGMYRRMFEQQRRIRA
jgi:subfamily B ATP-binding cassette protein MsbA